MQDRHDGIEPVAEGELRRCGEVSLRFEGENPQGTPFRELRAEHVADVLEGVSELVYDFEKAGVFHGHGPEDMRLMVHPPKEGSFELEITQMIANYKEAAALIGIPTLGQIIWWATKSFRADVKDFTYLENGNVKIVWQDDTVDEVPKAAWEELNKRKRRRRRQLRKIMRPLEDKRVANLETTSKAVDGSTDKYTLTRDDYNAVKPSEEIEESFDIFDIEGKLSAINFDDPDRWRVDTVIAKRMATVEDEDFLDQVNQGLALSNDDTYMLKIREDKTIKNGRTQTKWTILEIHKRTVNPEKG